MRTRACLVEAGDEEADAVGALPGALRVLLRAVRHVAHQPRHRHRRLKHKPAFAGFRVSPFKGSRDSRMATCAPACGPPRRAPAALLGVPIPNLYTAATGRELHRCLQVTLRQIGTLPCLVPPLMDNSITSHALCSLAWDSSCCMPG